MTGKLVFMIFVAALSASFGARAEEGKKQDVIAGPFGSKPIQIGIGPHGLEKIEGGFICELEASLGGGHFKEWGQTEEDAKSIVYKKCSDKAGLLLCKRDKAVCHEDK